MSRSGDLPIARLIATEKLGRWNVAALAATLNVPDVSVENGSEIEVGWHWVYFRPHVRSDRLAEDGNEHDGWLAAPASFARVMWAGADLFVHRRLRIGEDVTKSSTVLSSTDKSGRFGPLQFVTLEHRYSSSAGELMLERQHVVFAVAGLPPRKPRQDVPAAPLVRCVRLDEAQLFRFSALTFNSHRIHYDKDYCRQREGYPDLVVHGPLTAILALEVVRNYAHGRQISRCSFRALAPLFVNTEIRFHATDSVEEPLRLSALRSDGCVAMEADVSFAQQ